MTRTARWPRHWAAAQPLVLKDRAATLAFGIRTAPGTEPSRSSVFMPVMVGQVMRAAIRLVSLDRDDAFDEATVSLLSTVAASMGVALENARLFDETQEALERQTATAEMLQVIASSLTDVQPVFDVMVERAVKLCGAHLGRVYRCDGSTDPHGGHARHRRRMAEPRASGVSTPGQRRAPSPGCVIRTRQP